MSGAPRVAAKWRPSLGLVVFLAFATVLALPLLGIFFFRIYENQLVHETEAELIAQSAALAALFRSELETGLPADAELGADVRAAQQSPPDEFFQPIVPVLDLARDTLMPGRPDGRAAPPAHSAFVAIGARLGPIIVETQRVTLAGFRLLDPRGIVIGGRDELGLSLAHVEEVAEALGGRFRSVMRLRVSDRAPPPLYSMSRGAGLRIFAAMPVIVKDRVAGVVYASRTPSNVFKQLYEERAKVAAASLAVLAPALLIGLVFHRTIVRPVRELIARTAAITSGDRGAMRPLEHHGTAEFAQLSQSFLDMAESLDRRSDFVTTFASHVSHELKSPLTSIQGAAELLRDDIGAATPSMSDEKRRKFLDNIAADAGRLTAIARRLRELARAEQPPTSGAGPLAPVVEDIRAGFPALAIGADGDLDLIVRMSAENARIVFSHLADNAARHGARTLDIRIVRDGDMARVELCDDGDGISPNNRAKIFDSFFTTRRDGGGTGMGLAIVRAMLRAHGGEIALLDAEKGAAFELNIPHAGDVGRG